MFIVAYSCSQSCKFSLYVRWVGYGRIAERVTRYNVDLSD